MQVDGPGQPRTRYEKTKIKLARDILSWEGALSLHGRMQGARRPHWLLPSPRHNHDIADGHRRPH